MQKLGTEISSPPQTGSSNELEPSTGRCLTASAGRCLTAPQEAAERARLLFGCYRRGDANDPETYTAAVAANLALYAPEVVWRVTDPVDGIATRVGFLPTLQELREECERVRGGFEAVAKLKAMGYRRINGKWEKGQNNEQNKHVPHEDQQERPPPA